ncbi:MAG: T9SS type A sorting domain-containing protein [Bacteroidota bacterium]
MPDVCGNETTYTLFTEIIDTTAPDFTSVPDDLTLECDQTVPESEVEAFDSCSEVIYDFVETRTDGNCPYNYTLTRTWTATDGCGNANTATQLITVEDTTPPEIIFTEGYLSDYSPGDEVFVECAEYGNISLLIANSALARDNCSGRVPTTYTFEDRGNFDCAEYGYSGHLVSTWTATDECGNTSVATINWFLVDQSPPEFQGVPEDICTDELPPVPNVQAVDDCEFAVLEYAQSEPIDCEGGQYIERTWTATDVCGNTATATQRITLSPGDGPIISFDYPGLGDVMDGDLVRVSVDCGTSFEESLAELEAAVSIENNCNSSNSDVALELVEEGDCVVEGYLARYRLSVSATDVCGNTSTFGLLVDLVDETPPVVTSPVEITIECGTEVPTIKASDECGDISSITFMDSNPIEPSCADDPQVFERVWTVTDLCGNSTTFTQFISVIDNTGPVFEDVPADACEDESLDGTVTAIDECTGEEVPVQFDEVTTIEPGCGEVLTRTWTATDACGNTSTTTQQVFYADDVAPTMSFDHPLLVGLANGAEFFISVGGNLGSPEEPFLFGPSAVEVMDNCASNLVAEVSVTSRSSDDCAEDGFLSAYDYVWTGTDPCGNRSEITLTVYYIDKSSPDFFNVPEGVEVYCDNVPAPVTPIVSDDYDTDVEVSFSETQISVSEGVLITRIWTAIDDCGNESRAAQKILVVDNTLSAEFVLEPEVVACNSDDNLLSVIASGGNPPYSYEWALSSPLEDGYITTDPTQSSILFTMGFITQTFTVTITDAEGCQLVQSFTVICDFEDEEGLTGGSNAPSQLRVYPNPTRDYFRISSNELVEQAVTVRLYNLWGQEVLRKQIEYWPQEGLDIDGSVLRSGTYLLHLEQAGKVPLLREIVILD